MSRLTERWGPNEGNVSGRAKCIFMECDYTKPCINCQHYLVNNRLADYEDAIPYERLQEAAELLKRADYNKSRRYSVAVKKHKREKNDESPATISNLKLYKFTGHVYGDHVAGFVIARDLDEAKERLKRTYDDIDSWAYCNVKWANPNENNVCEIYYGG